MQPVDARLAHTAILPPPSTRYIGPNWHPRTLALPQSSPLSPVSPAERAHGLHGAAPGLSDHGYLDPTLLSPPSQATQNFNAMQDFSNANQNSAQMPDMTRSIPAQPDLSRPPRFPNGPPPPPTGIIPTIRHVLGLDRPVPLVPPGG
jgi:hypothetical protein